MTLKIYKIYKANLSNGRENAVQKALNTMREVLKNKLIPELDELENEINNKGIDYVLEKYPSLLPIIENLTNIREEIKLWIKKK